MTTTVAKTRADNLIMSYLQGVQLFTVKTYVIDIKNLNRKAICIILVCVF